MASIFVDPYFASAESFVNRTRSMQSLIKSEAAGCRVCTIYGVGGVGKSALAYQFTAVRREVFKQTLWYTLTNAPSCTELVDHLISRFPERPRAPDSAPLDHLLSCLATNRCLIVLDNLEVLLDSERFSSQFRPGYEDYRSFLQKLATVSHRSMVLITSRERPALLRDDHPRVQSVHLIGLSRAPARMLLERRSMRGDVASRVELVHRYGGNPLALSLAADLITDLHGGDIEDFLNGGNVLFSDLENLLDQHFRRLSPQELLVLFRLAVSRQPLTAREISAGANLKISRSETAGVLQLLLHRSLATERDGRFLLQYMILEFTVARLISMVADEIESGHADVICAFPLVDASYPEFVRQSQRRFVTAPIIEMLRERLASTAQISSRMDVLLDSFRVDNADHGSFGAANVMSLQLALGFDMSGKNLSDLVLRQLDLSTAQIPGASARNTEFVGCRFPDTHHYVFAMQFSPEGQVMALGQAGGSVVILTVPGGVRLKTLHWRGEFVRALAYAPDGTRLACTDDRGAIRVWNLMNDLSTDLAGHAHLIRGIAFSPDGETLFAAGTDPRLLRWSLGADAATQGPTLVGEHEGSVWGVDTAPTGTLVAVAGDGFCLALWDWARGERLPVESAGSAAGRWVRFNGMGDHVVVGCHDGVLRVWHVASGRLVAHLYGHTGPIWGLALACHDGVERLVSGSRDGTLRIWDFAVPEHARSLRTIQLGDGAVWPIDADVDGGLFAAVSNNATVRFWDTATSECLEVLNGTSKLMLAVAASSDGRYVASGGHDSVVRLWDGSTGECVRELPGHGAGVRSLAFDSSGTLLASASEDWDVRLWDVRERTQVGRLSGSRNWLYAVAFDPSGRRVAAGGADLTVRIWDISSGGAVREFEGHTGMIRCVEFAEDGRVLYSGGEDGELRRWDLIADQHTVLATVEAHITCLRLIGETVVTGGSDGVLRHRRLSDGVLIREWDVHAGGVLSLALVDGADEIVSAGQDGRILRWALPDLRPRGVVGPSTGAIASVTSISDSGLLAYVGMDEAIHIAGIGQEGRDERVLRVLRQFEKMDITGATGITEAQRQLLYTLGAVDDRHPGAGSRPAGQPEPGGPTDPLPPTTPTGPHPRGEETGRRRLSVFVSYTHRDEDLRAQLDRHLSALRIEGLIDTWHDRHIRYGTMWRDEIDSNLEAADVILLLISADFLASRYCRDVEMKRAMQRHREGTAQVIPIILRDCDWHGLDVTELQAMPQDGRAVTSWPNQDEAFSQIVKGIRHVVRYIGDAT